MGSTARLAVIFSAVVLASVAAGMARPAIAFLVRYGLGATLLATASLTSGFMAGRALASTVAGVLGDVFPARRGVIAGLSVVLAGVVVASIPFLEGVAPVLGVMAIWGIFSGLAWPTAQVVVSELGGGRSGTVLSVYFAIGSLGVSIGNFLFGRLGVGVEEMIWVSGLLLSVAGGLLLGSLWGAELRPRPRSAREIVGKIADPLVVWVLFSAFMLGVLSGILKEYFYIYAYETYGLEKSGLGDLLAAGGVAAVAMGLAAGWLSDRVGIPRVLVAVLTVSALGSLVIGFSTLGVAGLFAGYILASSGVRASMPLTRNASLVRGAGGSTVVGFSNTLSNLGTMTGPLLAGLLYEGFGGGFLYLVAGLLILVNALLYVVVSGSAGASGPGG